MLSESHTGTNISTMKQETEPIRMPSKEQEVTSMNDVLAQMRRSRSIHFLKSLPRTAIHKGDSGKDAELTMPAQFVQENCDKIEEWVILRAQLSRGKFSRPWLVRLRVAKTEVVRIGLGWHSFITDNHLEQGDSLIFLLKEDARSEFEVHMFRGPQGSPYFPDEGENSPIDDEEEEYFSASEAENKQSHSLSPQHDDVELNKALPRTKHWEKHRTYPGFRKRLTATSIRHPNGSSNSGQVEFPWRFLKTHGNQVQDCVKLQGIHEDSPTYLITCRRRPQPCLRVYIARKEWSRFVEDNGLKSGHELQFSLVDESYFVVRKL